MLEILNKERHEVEAPALVLEPHVEEILEPMSLPQNPQEPKMLTVEIPVDWLLQKSLAQHRERRICWGKN